MVLDLSVLVDCVMFVTFSGDIHLNLMKFDNFLHHVIMHSSIGPVPWSSTTGFPSVQKMGILLQDILYSLTV